MLKPIVLGGRQIHVSTPGGNVKVCWETWRKRWVITVGETVFTVGSLERDASFAREHGRILIQIRHVRRVKRKSFLSRLARRRSEFHRVRVAFVHVRRADVERFAENANAAHGVWLTMEIPLRNEYHPRAYYSETIADDNQLDDFFGREFWNAGYGISHPSRRHWLRFKGWRSLRWVKSVAVALLLLALAPIAIMAMLPLACVILPLLLILAFIVILAMISKANSRNDSRSD